MREAFCRGDGGYGRLYVLAITTVVVYTGVSPSLLAIGARSTIVLVVTIL